MNKFEYSIALKLKGFSENRISEFLSHFDLLDPYIDADDAMNHFINEYDAHREEIAVQSVEIKKINQKLKTLSIDPDDNENVKEDKINAITNLNAEKKPYLDKINSINDRITKINEAAESRVDFYITRDTVRDEVRPENDRIALVGEKYLDIKNSYSKLPLISRIFAHILPKTLYEPAKTLDQINSYEKMFEKYQIPESEYSSPNFANFVQENMPENKFDTFDPIFDQSKDVTKDDLKDFNDVLDKVNAQEDLQERLKNDTSEFNDKESVSKQEFANNFEMDNFFFEDNNQFEDSILENKDDFKEL